MVEQTVDLRDAIVGELQEILLRCFRELREKYPGDVAAGIVAERQRLAGYMEPGGLLPLGGNHEVVRSVMKIIDEFYAAILWLPARRLNDDDEEQLTGLMDEVLNSRRELLAGLRMYEVTPLGTVADNV